MTSDVARLQGWIAGHCLEIACGTMAVLPGGGATGIKIKMKRGGGILARELSDDGVAFATRCPRATAGKTEEIGPCPQVLGERVG